MKNLSFLIVLFMAGILIVSSCNKDEETFGPPTLDFKGGGDYVFENSEIAVNTLFTVGITAVANAESNKKLTTIRLTRTMNNTTFLDTTLNINDTQYNMDFQFNAQSAGSEEVIAFTITDDAGQTAEKSLTLTYVTTGTSVTKNTDVLMGSHNDDNGSFYSTVNKLVYNIADATANQSDIDFLFYLGAANGSTIASPADEDANSVYAISDWTTKNATMFATTSITADEFDAIGDIYDFPAFTGDISGITNLESGNVIMFKTVADKLGLIKVNQINGRGDHISLDVIIAE